jgi:cytochrome c biogenesis protein CcdA
MKRSVFDNIISFLLGISWAFIVLGAYIVFKIFLFMGVGSALFFSILYIILGLFFILLLETMLTYKERLNESKKQTQLLEEIRDALRS